MKETKRVDFWTGIGLMALSVGVWVLTADLPVPKRGIGPGQYPRVISATMFFLGLVLSVTNVIGGFPKKTKDINWRQLGRAMLMALMSFVYLRLLKLIGFPLLTPFFLFATIRLFGYKKWKTAIFVSVGSTAVIFLLFNVVFMVFLPLGRLF
ncbi:MAG: tripartite tricarboxylate transporter TctB family protein [Sphaerochaetaceae bacterium]|jgi:hypothetical protein|nr:tripartite tricarboxylate transporter TctB family protein [Sphaerochaetaceae bacterium]